MGTDLSETTNEDTDQRIIQRLSSHEPGAAVFMYMGRRGNVAVCTAPPRHGEEASPTRLSSNTYEQHNIFMEKQAVV